MAVKEEEGEKLFARCLNTMLKHSKKKNAIRKGSSDAGVIDDIFALSRKIQRQCTRQEKKKWTDYDTVVLGITYVCFPPPVTNQETKLLQPQKHRFLPSSSSSWIPTIPFSSSWNAQNDTLI